MSDASQRAIMLMMEGALLERRLDGSNTFWLVDPEHGFSQLEKVTQVTFAALSREGRLFLHGERVLGSHERYRLKEPGTPPELARRQQ